MTKIREMVENERPRERLWNSGADCLKTSELIAILLRTGLQGKSALVLGEELLQKYGDLDGLCRASAKDISKIKGIGMTKAVQLKAAFELASRLASVRRKEIPVCTPYDVQLLLGDEMRQLPHESLRVISLNTRLNLIAVEEISRGTINETVAHPRDVFHSAIIHNAYAVIIVHNHPSGDPSPSRADLDFTKRLRDAALLLQIEFLDHIILGVAAEKQPRSYYSFKEAGHL